MMAGRLDTEPLPESTYDLAVVGYGPTGMVLSALMGRQGHRVIVLDKYTGLYNLPRAACFDDEIMRTFQKLGIVEAVLPGTVVQTDYDWINGDGETLLEVSYDNPARGGWAALYMMYQPHLESVLDELCKSLPTVEVHQGVAVDTLVTGDEDVLVAGRNAAGERVSARARYVVGADGGAGFVRPALDIGFSDYRFQENWLVCDFSKRAPLPEVPTFRQVCDPRQPMAIVQIGPKHHRFSFMLAPDEAPERATDPAEVWRRVERWLTPEDAELVRVANYVFRSRIADRWRSDRVMLAGDAAHEMPPFLAQGMCSGMRDAHNLAWKLDLVVSGRAAPEILDTYQPEREPHVRFITEKAIELGQVQTLRDPEAARERDTRMLALRQARRAPDKIVYPPLSRGLIAEGAPHAGEFFVQGRVRATDGREGLFDDLVGPGPCLVVSGPEMLSELDPELLGRWRGLGGHVTQISTPGAADTDLPPAGTIILADLDGVYDAWFQTAGCVAAIVRPDWYLFGAADDGATLASLVRSLHGALVAFQRSGAPA
jgi:2-polyprenyl-6-methoxyphenol hydroxylase-like FAD-dependent oxidoreductase